MTTEEHANQSYALETNMLLLMVAAVNVKIILELMLQEESVLLQIALPTKSWKLMDHVKHALNISVLMTTLEFVSSNHVPKEVTMTRPALALSAQDAQDLPNQESSALQTPAQPVIFFLTTEDAQNAQLTKNPQRP